MSTPWDSNAERVADETFLSRREAEVVIGYHALRFPENALPLTKEEVYSELAQDLGIAPSTVRTYLLRAEEKLEKSLVTATFVDSPDDYLNGKEVASALAEFDERPAKVADSSEPLW